MKRKFLFSFYETPQGKMLQELEKKYFRRAITVSYKQIILQVGHLGWEDEFIDSILYQKFYLLDGKCGGTAKARKICAKSFHLPIQSETIDLVILPHLLEFDANRFQTMREIERVLKPEGELIILNFNPMNIWVRLQFVWNKKMADTWTGHFIKRSRISDWLSLLNFEIKTTSEFTLDSIVTTNDCFKLGKETFSSMTYAVRAVKRQYTLIPLTAIKSKSPGLVTAASPGLKSSTQRTDSHD